MECFSSDLHALVPTVQNAVFVTQIPKGVIKFHWEIDGAQQAEQGEPFKDQEASALIITRGRRVPEGEELVGELVLGVLLRVRTTHDFSFISRRRCYQCGCTMKMFSVPAQQLPAVATIPRRVQMPAQIDRCQGTTS